MRDRSFILVASVLAVLFIGAGALVLYDQSRDNRIAQGVEVAGVDVSGLTATQGRDRLASSLRAGLNEPIVVRGEGKSFEFTPRAARVAYDLDGMVDAAVRRSREGNLFTRTWRDLRGEPINVRLPADMRYSRLRVDRFVRRVDDSVSRKPVDAHLEFSGGVPRRRAGQDGLHVSFPQLRRDITAALLGRTPSRTVTVQTERVKPKVLRAELESSYPYLITVDRPNFKLRFFKRLKLVKSYTVAIGQAGYDTPTGMYAVQNKAVNPAWSVPNKPWAGSKAGQLIPGGTAANPLKARWMGIYDGAGIHGTDQTGSLGSAASHGCIRMAIPDVVELYDQVPVATPVYIA